MPGSSRIIPATIISATTQPLRPLAGGVGAGGPEKGDGWPLGLGGSGDDGG
jgi:hypothetical protein